MNYATLFPAARPHDEPAPGLVYFDPVMDCMVCRAQTHFADIDHGVGLCSEECALEFRKGRRAA